MSYRKSFENCTKANQPLWADKAKKLCEFLILAEWRSKADLVAFFKENRQPVCTTGGKYFKLELKTPLGPTYAEVHFSRDGRPKIEKSVQGVSHQEQGRRGRVAHADTQEAPLSRQGDIRDGAVGWLCGLLRLQSRADGTAIRAHCSRQSLCRKKRTR